jgi:uncharacterized protein YqfA (UPF0365 family)
MDYVNLRNVQADTEMRNGIGRMAPAVEASNGTGAS